MLQNSSPVTTVCDTESVSIYYRAFIIQDQTNAFKHFYGQQKSAAGRVLVHAIAMFQLDPKDWGK